MRILLTGVSCVGKTTIGIKLATIMDVRFFDLDKEVETFFGTSIGRLQKRLGTAHSFRNEAAKALAHLVARPESRDSVIALPPSGLMGGYMRVIKKSTGITVAIHDRPEHILDRITFYDLDSKPIGRVLTHEEKQDYLKEITRDISYFGKTYNRAHLQVDVSGMCADAAAREVKDALDKGIPGHDQAEDPTAVL